jgi:hypothetical protein
VVIEQYRKSIAVKNNTCILIVILSVLFIGCHNKDGLMDYELTELGAVIKIPDSFKSVTEKDIVGIVFKENDLELKNDLLKVYKLNPKCKFLIDTLDPYKFIMTAEITPSFKIDSNALYFIIDHERSISSSSPNINDSVYYVGSKMGSIAGFSFIESKYLRKLNAKKRINIGPDIYKTYPLVDLSLIKQQRYAIHRSL